MEYGLVILWLVTYLALLYVSLPLANALVPAFADRGAGIALPLGLAVLWTVAYFVGRVSITAGLWLGLAVLAVLSGVLWYVDSDVEVDNRQFVETGAVFTLAFGFVIFLRAHDPGAYPGLGEKFLDMSILQSLLRSNTLPPEDVWFAGESIQYYYGGHYLASLLARITGTEGRFAYNLALSGFYAMLVTAVYGVAGSIAAHRGFSKVQAGAIGAFFVGFAGNLFTAGKFLLGAIPLGGTLAGFFGIKKKGVYNTLAEFSYWDASRIIPQTINEFPLFAWLNGDLHAHMMSPPFLVVVVGLLAGLYMDGSDRPLRQRMVVLFGVVPMLAGMLAATNTWSFPTVGGLVAVALTTGVAPPVPSAPSALRSVPPVPRITAALDPVDDALLAVSRRVALALLSGAVVLVLGFLWSLPFWLEVGTASASQGPAFLPDRSPLGGLLVVHGAFLVVFWLYTYRHAKPNVDAGVRTLALLGVLVATTLVFGAPAVGLFAPLIALGWLLIQSSDPDGLPPTPTASPSADGGRPWPKPGFEFVVLASAAGLIVLVEFVYLRETLAPQRFNTVFKVYSQVWILAAIAAGVMLARLLATVDIPFPSSLSNRDRWTNALVGGGLLLLIGAEYSLVKLWLSPAWLPGPVRIGVLAAIAAVVGYGLIVLVTNVGTVEIPSRMGLSGPRAGKAIVAVAVVLVVATSLYGVLAVDELVTDHGSAHEDPTLDALSFLSNQPYEGNIGRPHPREAPAIEYLLDVEGQPNMVSYGPGPPYRWTNGPASLTGIPTVAGLSQERGYRSSEAYEQRVADVKTIYTGNATQRRQLLKQYNVELIYVGPKERAEYGLAPSLGRLEAVSVEKSWESVTIYRVDQSKL